MKILFIILFFISHFIHGQSKTNLTMDSLTLSFQDKLFSSSPLVSKQGNYFYLYDLVSEKLVVFNERGEAVKDSKMSAGKAKMPAGEQERKLFYKNLFVGKQGLFFINGSIFRYDHTFKKLPIHKLSYNLPNASFRHITVADMGFLVVEGKEVNHYIVRLFTAFATSPDYLETYTKGFYQRPMYAVFEKLLSDTTSSFMKKLIIPHDKIYQEKFPLGYTYTESVTLGKKNSLITTEGSTEKIRIYDLEGKEIEVLGEKGRHMTAQDTIPYLPYPQDSTVAFWREKSKLEQHYQITNPVYGRAYYDAQSETIYREYSPHIEVGERRKRFMQVYKNKKLIADVPFPPNHRIIVIEDGIIWAYKVNPDGETPPKYIYKLKIQ